MVSTDHSPEGLSQSNVAYGPFLRTVAGQSLLTEQSPVYQLVKLHGITGFGFFHNAKTAIKLLMPK